jgi:hypothetical protein
MSLVSWQTQLLFGRIPAAENFMESASRKRYG